ncbi:hypothetical protein NLJ89_g2538 [Agrocybe chaxingu]|uniref:BTB domain-containing protein n=1 Tax=Agrocybe chaxingu TaxID=84603 RepID=A0A9W8K753_9AGAR|nr:hypothetical protein NLJ89_g2538 [Agrocybe chaxingu]
MPITVHSDFGAGDADVTFQPSNVVQYRIHRKNLEVHFPGSEFDTRGEATHLTEDADTLAILFQFTYPRRHPTLQDADFKTLASVAEAVGKYQVFSVMSMNTCQMRLRRFLPEHPVEILVHAIKHDYRELKEDASPYFARSPSTAWQHFYLLPIYILGFSTLKPGDLYLLRRDN